MPIQYYNDSTLTNYVPNSGDRLIGGGAFLGPFILGGITGGLLAPSFYQRPYYNNYYYPYQYYPY